MPPELEQTLALLSSHRSVLGYLLLSRGDHVSIIRHSGVVFEGEQGKKYASVIGRMVESVQAGLEEVSGSENDGVRNNRVPSFALLTYFCRTRFASCEYEPNAMKS
jgi:hypothetical protein